MKVIANFDPRRTLLYVGCFIGVLIVFAFLTLKHPSGTSIVDHLKSEGPVRFNFAIVGWIAAVLLVIRNIAILFEFVFHGRRAVWVDKDSLVFMNIYWDLLFKNIALSEVKSFEIGSLGSGRPRGILIQLKNGTKRSLPVFLFCESADEILRRLSMIAI